MKRASILNPGSSHWYDGTTGEPRYEIESTKGGMRPVTLRDAKKYGYANSVTSIIKEMVPAPGLEKYKFKELFKAMRDNPQEPGESDEEYYARCCRIAAEDAAKAADLGTRLHGAIDAFETQTAIVVLDDVATLMDNYLLWREGNIKSIIKSEGYIPTDFGYGGRFDILAEVNVGRSLIDFKTKKTKIGEKIFRGPEWGYQLSAYAQAMKLPPETLLWIVAISTTEPGRIEVIDYTADRETHTTIFNHLLEAWFLQKNYDPRKERCNNEAI